MSECVCVCVCSNRYRPTVCVGGLPDQFFSHEYFHLPIFSSLHRDKLHSVPHKYLVINSY